MPVVTRVGFVLSLLLISAAAHGVPANFQNENFVTGLTEPTGFTFTPDGRMIITERAGRVLIVPAGSATPNATPLLQLSSVNITGGERGVLSIALHPNFATNGYYYLFYTSSSPLRDRVSRFTMSGNTTVAGSELVIWQESSTASEYHHGGALAFGPDGYLYISIGDHVNSGAVQSLTTYNGKILRLQADGTIPTSNPFYDGAGPNLDAIWALGLRNPYRFSFDSTTGRMYIGDVGDNDPGSSIEEINVGAAGGNFGWPVCQGPCNAVGMINPIYSYSHSGRDAAVTAGVVYRGNQFPASYRGSLFFGDYVQNWIRLLTLDANGNATGTVNFEPANGTSDGPYGDIVDIEQGPDGALYYADIGLSWEGSSRPGSIRRIRYTASNQPPSSVASATPLQGTPPLNVNFSSAGSIDPEGQSLSYTWSFGDLATSTLANPSHTYSAKGTYIARLTVSDGVNMTLSDPIVITVGTPPTPIVQNPSDGATFRAGDTISFSGSATDSLGNPLPASALSWNVLFLHDNHTHPFLGPVAGVTSGSFTIPLTGHDYRGFTRYVISLTATDADGLKGTASAYVFPQKVNLTMDAAPTGLNLIFDGITEVTPFIWDTLIGFQHTMEAPNQIAAGSQYNFQSWSDGGAQIHTITVPTQSASITATFQQAPLTGLMAAYGFNEGQGTSTADASGNNRTGTLVNAAWAASGRNGAGITFNGTTSRITAGSITLPATFTIEAWLNNPSNQSWETIATVGQDRDFFLQSGVVSFETPGTTRNFGSAITTNVWHHVAITSDGTAVRAYLDGNQVGTNQPAITTAFTGALQLGSWILNGGNTDFLSGTMDDVRIYSIALSQAQIQSDMNTPVGGAASNPAPATTSISPATVTAGGAGFTLTVNGTGFVSGASVVQINGVNRTTTYVSSTQLTAAILNTDIATTGTPAIRVVTAAPGGGTSNAQTLTVNNPAPTTTSLSPSSVAAGNVAFTLTVNGTGFVNGSTVRWNNTDRVTTYVNATQLTASIAAADVQAAGTATVTVATSAPGGGTSNGQTFTINASNPVPTTTSISPATVTAGGAGFTLTVNGTGFVSGSSVVRLNGNARTTTFVNASQLTASILASDIATAGTASITVFTSAPGGGTSNAQSLAINNPAPAITSLSPSSVLAASGAFTLTVNGSGFINGSIVRWNNADRATTFVNASQLTASIAAADVQTAGTASLTVVTPAPGGGTSNTQTFTISATNPVPTTTSISPATVTAGGAGFTLTVNGTGFVSGASVVRLNGNARTTTFVNATQLTASILATDIATAGTAPITVFTAAPGGGTSNSQTLAINNPTPATTSLSPSSAVAGSAAFTLTVNGSNFINGSTVRWNGSDRATTFVNSTQLTASIAAADVLSAGTPSVTVFTPAPGGGTSNAQTFTINAGGGTPTGLVAAYGMNEGTGLNIADASGNGNNGTVANTTWTTSGRFGAALVFNGTNSWATVLDSNSLDLTTAMTLEAWVYPTVRPSNWRAIIAKEQPGALAYYLEAGSAATSIPAMGIFTGGAERNLSGGTRLNANAWVHLAATYDGTTQRLYVDGVQVASRAQTGAIATSTGPLRMGGHSVWGEYFTGRIDEVRVYNRALTAAEIQNDMNTAVTP